MCSSDLFPSHDRCGQCIGCRIQQREDWATRIELEARQWPKEQVWFITLTYDDDHVPGMILKTGEIMRKVQYVWKPGKKAPESVQTLMYPDVQKFLKRLRRAYKGKLRYFCAGEYGEQTARPHYHLILFNYNPEKLEPYRLLSKEGYYTDTRITKCWPYGIHNMKIGRAHV